MISSTASLSNYEDFYREWYPRAVKVASVRGFPDPEAVASDIMIVFFTKDYLERYDPTVEGAASFDTWVNNILYKRIDDAHRAEKRKVRTKELEPKHNVIPDEVRVEPTVEFKLLAMEAFELIDKRYGHEMSAVWVSVVKQVVDDTTGKSGRALLYLIQQHLCIGAQTASKRMERLRDVILGDAELREMLGAGYWAHEAA